MNREGALGFFLITLLLGSILLLARRPLAVSDSTTLQPYSQGNVKIIPVQEPRRYQNKEIRNIEWNADGLPIRIEITRDYTIT
jgi:hypothetical protein